MDRFGLIHDKLDIKLLILFVLRRLPDFVDENTLSELVINAGEIGYFDYNDCLSELLDTGHIEKSGSKYRITEKGEKNVSVVESSLPFSIRQKMERELNPVAMALERGNMVRAFHAQDNGGCTVSLSLSDGVGNVLSMDLLVPDEETAFHIEEVFRQDAEDIYQKIISLF